MKKPLIIIGAIISGVCLYLAFRGLSLREIGRALQQADGHWILAALAVYASCFVLRAVRWKSLLSPIQVIPSLQLLRPLGLGFFANNVLPFRMGELIRAHIAGRKFNISRTASFGSVVVERVFDAATFLTIFLALTIFYPFPAAIQNGARAMGIGCALLAITLWLASAHQTRAQALIKRLPLSPRWQAKADDLLLNFTQGISGLKNARYVAKAFVLSLGVWILEGTTLYLIARAFPIGLHYPEAFFVLFFLGLSVALPQAPGYVGTVELFGTMALSLLGTPKEMGLPVILTLHGLQFTFVGVFGMYALWKEKLSLGRLIDA